MKSKLEMVEASDVGVPSAFRMEDLLKAADPDDVIGRSVKLVWMVAANQASTSDTGHIKSVLPKLKAAGLPKPLIDWMTSIQNK